MVESRSCFDRVSFYIRFSIRRGCVIFGNYLAGEHSILPPASKSDNKCVVGKTAAKPLRNLHSAFTMSMMIAD